MGIKTANDLFVSQLRDIYSAEKQAIRAYSKMAKATRAEDLKTALRDHLDQTEKQIERLDRIFEILDKKPSGRTCEAMKGLVDEAHEALREISKGPILDAAILAVGQRLEHYEIASYGTVVTFARAMGQAEIQALLGETLGEEKAADERLSQIAEGIHAQLLPKPEIEAHETPAANPTRARASKKTTRKKVAAKSRKA